MRSPPQAARRHPTGCRQQRTPGA